MQIIIPMSGMGQRFVNSGYKTPKPLIKVDNKPIIEHVTCLFPGENNFTFICNEKHLRETDMKDTIVSICPDAKIYEVPVTGRQGPVHAVSLIFDYIDNYDETIVCYCDFGTWWDYNKFIKDTRSRNADGAVVCYRGFHPHMLGADNYAFLKETCDDSRWMECIQEKKPFTENRMDEYASNGIYYFKTGEIMKTSFQELMDKQIKVNNEYYVSMVYNLMVEKGLKVSIFEIEHMLQWGTPYDLENYNFWSNYFNKLSRPQKKFKYNCTLVLPLAGHGSRFSNENYTLPKPLLPVNNNPMIVEAVNQIPDCKNKIFIDLEEHNKNFKLNEILKKHFPECLVFGINEVTQGQACTTDIGIKRANLDPETPILISACDNGVYYDTEKYDSLMNDKSVDVIVWSFRNNASSKNNPNMYAWMETDNKDNILSVSCKKFNSEIHNLKTSHVIIGTMFFRKSVYFTEGLKYNYKFNIRTNNEFYVDDIINVCIKQKLKVKVFEVENYICWGTPDDYKTFNYWRDFFHKCWWHKFNKMSSF